MDRGWTFPWRGWGLLRAVSKTREQQGRREQARAQCLCSEGRAGGLSLGSSEQHQLLLAAALLGWGVMR